MIDLSGLKRYVPAIEIRMSEPGVYAFTALEADGKSYLWSLLHQLRDRERVVREQRSSSGLPRAGSC